MNPNNTDPFSQFRGTTGLQPIKLSSGSKNPFDSYRSQTVDTKTPQGLYDLASQAGLEKQARAAIERSGGESQKYLSGGFIMDAMDILNTASYGVVGMVKGKGFIDGVKNRESLSDDDSLGKYGFAGKVAGFIGDIVLDPLTYVAPIKIVSKIPGLTKDIGSVGKILKTPLHESAIGKSLDDFISEQGTKVYHGTRESLDYSSKNRLFSTTESIDVASEYASGGGGYRKISDIKYITEDETGLKFFRKDSGDFVNKETGKVLKQDYLDVGISRGGIRDGYSVTREGATVHSLYGKIKSLNLTRGSVEDAEKFGNILSEIPKTDNRFFESFRNDYLTSLKRNKADASYYNFKEGKDIVERDKFNSPFKWESTKHDKVHRIFQDIVNPALEKNGYNAIRYDDDTGITTAFTDIKNLKSEDELKKIWEEANGVFDKGGLIGRLNRKLLGELTTIEVEGQKFFNREGGWTPLTFLQDKLIYGAAVDKSFLEGYERTVGKNEALAGTADQLLENLGKIKPELFSKTLSKDETGRIISTRLEDLQREFSPEDFKHISDTYKMRDDLMQKLVDLEVISKDTADAHWETYLKQTYDEFLEAKGGGRGKSGVGLEMKGRKEGLTEEKMKELGQVDNPSVIWGTTLLKQIDLVKKAELQKLIRNGYAMSDDMLDAYRSQGGKMENLYRVPESRQYELRGKEIDLKKQYKDVRVQLKDVLKKRKIAFKDDKELTSTIAKMEKELTRLKTANEKDLGEALSGFKQILRENTTIKEGPLPKQPTSLGQKAVAEPLKTWLNSGSKSERLARETMSSADLWKEYKFTREGIALERAFEDPRLMYQWRSPQEFLDAIRYPNRKKILSEETNRIVELSDKQQIARIERAEKNARKFGEIEQTKKVLEGTNLKLVQEAVNRLEDEYADLLWKKSGILESLEFNKHGQLAGKWVSKEIWDIVKGTFEPTKEFGESIVMPFKHAKVIWNPASHIRNAFSAGIQNWWKLGIGPWRVDAYYDAMKEFKNPSSKVLSEMKELGFNERSGYIQELLGNYVTNKELMDKTLAHQLGDVGAVRRWGKHVDRMMMKSYAHVDNVAKVAAYKYGIQKGMTKEDAYRRAVAATFNYSEVTPFVQRMRKAIWGVPFVTFALKATPLVGSTLAHAPGRISVFGKARNDLFKAAGIEGEQEAEAMPDYMRDDMFVMRLPWKDGNGRSMYFDLSYIIPFGALADGSYLKNPASANPVTQLVRELSRNETFSGSKIFRESDDIGTVLADISAHVLKLGLPPPVTDMLSDGYMDNGERRPAKYGWDKFARTNTQDLGPGERSFYQETFRMLGVGALPYNLTSRESSLAYRQKENLSKLLTENGVMKTFDVGYLPTDSELRPENKVNSSFKEGRDTFTK